jgi:hypothetical protein
MERNDRHPVKTRSLLTFVVCALLAVYVSGTCSAQDTIQYISFDGPNAGTQSGQGTFPVAINRKGWIALNVIDESGVSHGYLRTPDGTFIAIQPPGTDDSSLAGINAAGDAIGCVACLGDVNQSPQGFFRDHNGTYIQLGHTGATSVVPAGINDRGQVTGFEVDTYGYPAFFWDERQPNTYVVFNVPNAVDTSGLAINNKGRIAGIYQVSNPDTSTYGFVRNPDGSITTFHGAAAVVTWPAAINNSGWVTGYVSANATDGFLRDPDGTFSRFVAPGSLLSSGTSINDNGVVVGFAVTASNVHVAIQREQFGNVAIISIPFQNTGSTAVGINQGGHMTGTYTDAAGASHGWVN